MSENLVTGWKVPSEERNRLLAVFPARFPDIVADHVTLRAGTNGNTPLPGRVSGLIVGATDDAAGVQALIVEVAGETSRSDGGTYHITWSLDRAAGRTARESNEVIARRGWQRLPHAIAVRLEPDRWPRSGR